MPRVSPTSYFHTGSHGNHPFYKGRKKNLKPPTLFKLIFSVSVLSLANCFLHNSMGGISPLLFLPPPYPQVPTSSMSSSGRQVKWKKKKKHIITTVMTLVSRLGEEETTMNLGRDFLDHLLCYPSSYARHFR